MYKLQNSGYIIRTADGASIPQDAGNSDYRLYLDWLALGNTPAPADPVTTVPILVVTMRQARLALLQVGLLAQVNSAVANMPGVQGEAARIVWEFSSEVRRDDQLVSQLATVLGLTSEQLDQLFTTAGGL